jgi:hypothetical protein
MLSSSRGANPGNKKAGGIDMKLNFNLQGAERKTLVQAISEILETKAVYLKTPTYAFSIGEYHLDRYGLLTGADNEELAAALQERGFIAEATEEAQTEATEADTGEEEPAPDETPTAAEEADTGETGAEETEPEITMAQDGDSFTIEMPSTGFDLINLEKLCKLVKSKETLLKAALDTDALPIQHHGDILRFPWWNRMLTSEEVEAYSTLISLICKTAKTKSRITATDSGLPTNPKYAMRCWLLSLGCIGKEYQNSRRTILAKLEGDSSWKNGKPEKAVEETASEAEPEAKTEFEMLMEQLPEGTEIIREYNASENGERRIITNEDGEKRYVVQNEDGYPRLIHKP